MNSISIPSPCKVNLRLEILRKRPDGYHEIRTLFHRISLQDTITLARTPAPGMSITVTDQTLPADETNLACRAAALLLGKYPQPDGLAIHIDKQVPAGAGLGGGSSNAAATLLGLQKLYNIEISLSGIMQLGTQLGADVPFFLSGATSAWASGIGEKLTPLQSSPQLWFLVVFPQIHISTPWAYQTFSKDILLTNHKKNTIVDDSFREFVDACRLMYNDFELVVFPRYAEIQSLKESLLSAGAAGALLSGSGSSVFGVFADRQACEAALAQIPFKGTYRVFTAHSI